MSINKISKEGFTAWAAETTIDYASETLQAEGSGIRKRLRFIVKLGGGYRIELGNTVLYEGGDMDLAVEAYQNAGEPADFHQNEALKEK